MNNLENSQSREDKDLLAQIAGVATTNADARECVHVDDDAFPFECRAVVQDCQHPLQYFGFVEPEIYFRDLSSTGPPVLQHDSPLLFG